MAGQSAHLAAPTWRTTQRGHSRGHDRLMSHAIRHDRTLCGLDATRVTWLDGLAERCTECAAVPEGHAIYPDLLALGLTPRQVDDWCRKGLLLPDDPHPGFGHRRTWSPREYAVAADMAVYVAAGLRPVAARKAAATDGWLSEHVRVLIEPQPAAQAA